MGAFRSPALLCLAAASVLAQTSETWSVARSEHFEVYSQTGEEPARAAAVRFERLRAFFRQQTWLKLDGALPVRVIGFRSAKEYQAYRLRTNADAYYVGTDGRDYIVMASLDPSDDRIAAHEFAHLTLHASGVELPPWLSEGLAELYSTVRIGEHSSSLGGKILGRSQVLRRNQWMPLPQLLELPRDSALRDDREKAELFYAQSWALADMLMLSPDYAAGFAGFIRELTSGERGPRALTTLYGKSLETIERDLHAWVNQGHSKPEPLPGVATGAMPVRTSGVPPFAARSLLADLLMTEGELNRAASAYRELAREHPEDAEISVALGTLALRQGDPEGARREWKHAIDQGVRDAALCFRYAVLAASAGMPPEEIRPALERAIALRPDFDDARFNLALIEKSAGHYEAAVQQFRAMHRVAPGRAFGYWIAMADALNELGRRDEAKTAAQNAAAHATTVDERNHAAEIAYLARTDLEVQFSNDAKLVTTRVPHEVREWNAFIQPGDDMRRVEGALREINCDEKLTRIRVEASGTRLTLVIQDPTRVLMRNAPAEFTCGKQRPAIVTVDYAATKTAGVQVDGIVRGMEFH
jgi:tetratricopeptide (TPR) repeat protein